MIVGERQVAAMTNEAFSPTLLNQLLHANVVNTEMMKQAIVDDRVATLVGTPKKM